MPESPRVLQAFAGLAAMMGLIAGCQKRAPVAADAAPPADRCPAWLTTFDTLDFTIFSGQKWDRFAESHASDITVTWPDGHETHGLGPHIDDLKAMFVYAPNTNIAEHPIRVCSGEYTAVMGIMTGTFSAPMPIGGGKTIPPTGKSFRLNMTTIGHWSGTTMDHEWLFWDNQAFMKQIGLAQ